jgi:NAD(P)-dependent dehydrogenase (short-subunit alcohol dehydrogenase family)
MTGKCANKVGGRWDRSRLTGSIASIKGFPSFSVYNASKAAVRSFARSWLADLKGRAISIKVLSPGHVETPGLSGLMSEEQKAEAVALVPLGRIGTPDNLGKAAAFLVSDNCAYVTGIELVVELRRFEERGFSSASNTHPSVGRGKT